MGTLNLVGTPEACRILRRSHQTVNRWAADGRLPVAYQHGGGGKGARLYLRADVEALAAELAADESACPTCGRMGRRPEHRPGSVGGDPRREPDGNGAAA